MKKVLLACLILVLCVIIFFLVLRGCSYLLIDALSENYGNRDWHVELNNGYEITKINSKSIILINSASSSTGKIVIPDYINAYRYNEDYLEILCARDGPNDLLGVDSEEDKYFLIEFEKQILHGPFTKKEFINHCLELSIPEMGDWLTTNPRPQNAIFD